MLQQKGTDKFERFSVKDFLIGQQVEPNRVTCSMFGFDDAIVDEYTKEIEVLPPSQNARVFFLVGATFFPCACLHTLRRILWIH